MSNTLLNKLKLVNSSRERLKTILEGKSITGVTSLPALVESVNELYPKDYVDPEWDGVPEQAEPEYWKPEFDYNSVYTDDTSKDAYTNVAMFIINVNDGDVSTLPANVFNGFSYFKYSDTDTLVAANTNYRNTSHIWDKTKDIELNGVKYRWVMGYSNLSTQGVSIYSNSVNVEDVIIFKGTYTTLSTVAYAKYVEVMADCTFTSTISAYISTDMLNHIKTFICNADSIYYLANSAFFNCYNLAFCKITSSLSIAEGTETYSENTFTYCYGLRYLYINECVQFYGYAFRNIHECYIQINKCIGAYLGYSGSNYLNQRAPFNYMHDVKLRIGTINSTGYLWYNSDDTSCSPRNLEIEIDTINRSNKK